jgi:hypothetical protein
MAEYLNGDSVQLPGMGAALYYHTSSNALLVGTRAAAADTENAKNKLILIQSGSEGHLPASYTSHTVIDSGKRPIDGFQTAPQSGNGDRVLMVTHDDGADDADLLAIESGSAGWKVTVIDDNIQGPSSEGNIDISSLGAVVSNDIGNGSGQATFVVRQMISADPALASTVASTVGSSGGTVKAGGTNSSPVGQVVIPSNALGGNVSVSVDTAHASSSVKLGLRTLGEASSNIIRLTPHGTKFSSAVTVTIRLKDGASTDNLQLLKRNSETGQWYDTGVSLSVSSGTVSFTTTSFSDYIIIGGQKVARTKINNIQLDRLERANSVLASALNLTASANTVALDVIDSDRFLLQSASGESQIVSASAIATYMATKVQPTHIQTTDTDTAGTYRVTFTDSTDTDTTSQIFTDGDLVFNAGTNALSMAILSASSDISGSAALFVGSSATVNNGLTVTAGGATVTAGGLTVSAGGASITGPVTSSAAVRTGAGLITGQSILDIGTDSDPDALRVGSSNVNVSLSLESSGPSSGAFTVAGGVGIGDDLFVGNEISGSGDLKAGTITMAEFTVARNGNTDIDGTLNVEGVPTFQAGAVFSSGITTAGAIAGATTISGSSTISGHALDIETDANVAGDLTVVGDLVIQGATTTIETTNLLVEDSLIEIARGNGGSRASNAGAGLFISGTLANDVSLTVQGSGGRLRVSGSTPGFDTVFGGSYAINGSSVLNNTTLGSSVVNSSLTSLGTQAEALNMGSQGITAAGAIAGASTVSGSGLASAGGGLAAGFGSQFTVSNAGAVVAASLNNSAGGITNAGSINGATTISGSGQLSLAVGISAANENFTVSSAGAVVAASLNNSNGGITNAGSIAGATSVDGSGDLTMGTITMTGFAVDADGDTALKSLTVDDGSTIGTDSDSDMLTLTNGSDITVASDLDLVVSEGKLKLGSTAVTSTAAELNLLDGVSGLVQADFTKLAAVDATAAELNLLDASAGSDTALASGDGVIFGDASDSNNTKKATMQNVADLLGAGDGLQVNDSTAAIRIDYVNDIFSSASHMNAGLSYDMITASLSATPLSSSLQVYLNGMLQVVSGAVDISGSSSGVYTPVSAFDYKLSDGSSEFGLGNAMDTATKVIFAEPIDNDDVVQIKYIKK